MASTTAGASHGGKRNNGGTVVFGGDIDANGPILSAPDTSILTYHSGVHGTRVASSATANIGTRKPYAAGTFAYTMVPGKFVGMRYSDQTVSGVSKATLETGTGDFGIKRSINRIENTYRYHITAWDYVTGAATKGGNAGDSVSFGNDHAARPTRAVPGELVYTDTHMTKGTVPTQADYDEKTG